jgi:hypothetical protein
MYLHVAFTNPGLSNNQYRYVTEAFAVAFSASRRQRGHLLGRRLSLHIIGLVCEDTIDDVLDFVFSDNEALEQRGLKDSRS